MKDCLVKLQPEIKINQYQNHFSAFVVVFLEMKKDNNSKPFQRKSHNQKIHDAHVLRTKEKESAKQVTNFPFSLKNLF
jgi:hypothetical protein